jgi:acetoin utilization protein AcuB
MIVSMCMTRDLVTVPPSMPVAEAAALMAQKRIRRLPVVEGQGEEAHLVGIVSATDIIRAFPPHVNPFAVEAADYVQTPFSVETIMNRWLQTTTPDTPIEDAAAIMNDQKIGALPVLSGKKLVGIITESDVFRAFVSLFTSNEPATRVTFDVSKGEDVFQLMSEATRKYRVHVESLFRAEQGGRAECVVRLTGNVDKFVDALWQSGHPVLSVLRFQGKSEK